MRRPAKTLLVAVVAVLLAYLAAYFFGHRNGRIESYLVHSTGTSPFHSYGLAIHSVLDKAFQPMDGIELRLRQRAVQRKVSGEWVSSDSQGGRVEVFSNGKTLKIVRCDSLSLLSPGEFPLQFGTYSYSMVAEIDADTGVAVVLVPQPEGAILLEVHGPNDDDPFAGSVFHRISLTAKSSS